MGGLTIFESNEKHISGGECNTPNVFDSLEAGVWRGEGEGAAPIEVS